MNKNLALSAIIGFAFGLTFGCFALHAQETSAPLRLCHDFLRTWSTDTGQRTPREPPVDYQAESVWYPSQFFSDPKALAICSAIEKDDVDTIDRLVDGGFDINHRGKKGMTFLLFSLMFPGEVTRHLLENGADPNLPLDSGHIVGPMIGTTATQVIAGFGSPEDFRYILDHGTDANLLSPLHYEPLICFAYPKPANLKILLAAGVDINQRHANRAMPLLRMGYLAACPETLLCYLMANGDYRSCWPPEASLLLLVADAKEERGYQGKWRNVFGYFEAQGIDLAQVIEDFQNCKRDTSDNTGRQACVVLLDRWLPPEKDRELEFFGDPRIIELVRAIRGDDLPVIERLARSGVDINAKGKADVTPLFWATQADVKTFATLLDLGADPSAQLNGTFFPRPNEYLGKGDTIVHWATRYGSVDHLRLALTHGGNANARRAYCEWTPVYDLLHSGTLYDVRTIRRILERDPRVDGATLGEETEAKLSLLVHGGNSDVNVRDCYGRTPTMIALGNHQIQTIGSLLRLGADCRTVDDFGYDLMLQWIQESRRWGGTIDPAIAKIIEDRGGNFELAEKTVWKGDDWRPVIDLKKLAPEDRPWLPPASDKQR